MCADELEIEGLSYMIFCNIIKILKRIKEYLLFKEASEIPHLEDAENNEQHHGK